MERTISRQGRALAIDTLPLPAWSADGRGRDVRYNERWDRYVGHAAGLRSSWIAPRYVHHDDLDAARVAWRDACEAGEPLELRVRLRRFDGEWRWHHVAATPVRDASGRVDSWLGVCIDIHEDRRSLEELTLRARLLEAQAEASLDAIVIVSSDRRLLWANERARELWDMPEERAPIGCDLKVAAFASAHRVLDPATHLDRLDALYADPYAVVQDDLTMADGRTMERYSAPVHDADGTPVGRVNTYRDVTTRVALVAQLERERKQLCDSLDEVRSLNLTLERLASTAVLINDERLPLEPMLHMATHRARDLLDAERCVLLLHGAPQLDAIGRVTSSEQAAGRTEADAGGDRDARALEVALQAADGTTYGTIAVHGPRRGTRFGDRDRSVLVQVAQLVSSSVQARLFTAAVGERAMASIALDYTADAVVLVDRDGVVRLWNPGAARITGSTEQDVIGRAIDEAVDGWPELRALVPVPRGGGCTRPTTVPLRSAGEERWVSIVGAETPDGGIVYAFRDVTNEHRLERMRADIVSTVSHELRTPLTSIYGLAETLQHHGESLDTSSRNQLVDVIVDQSARLATLVDDILVTSRLDSGSLVVRATTVDVAQVVAEAVDMASAGATTDHRIVASYAARPLRASADRDRLHQILMNLLDNAVKYSPDGGAVTVRVREVEGEVLVAVEDQGLGIPEPEHDRVFERFHRLDPGMVRGIPGTGLGLYISRELARRMGGDLTLRSTEGSGSTFTLHLPLAAVRDP